MAQFFQLLINGIAVGCIYGLVALGFVLIYKATQVVNFAQGDVLMLGAFTAYSFIALLQMDFWLGMLLTALVMACFGMLLDRLVLRRMIGQPQFTVVMLTLGLGFIFRAFASIAWGLDTYSIGSPFGNLVFDIGSVVVSMDYVLIIVCTAILYATLYLFFSKTRLGIAMQATSQNQLAAYYMGIPVKTIFSLIWGISAAVTAVAGILMAPVSLVNVNMGEIGMKSIAAAVLGGFGSIPGAVVGGLVIGIAELFSGVYLSDALRNVIAYVILLSILAVRPKGILGGNTRKKV